MTILRIVEPKELYVVYTRSGGPDCVDPPEGVYSSLEKAEEEADNHAIRVYNASKVLMKTSEVRCYGDEDSGPNSAPIICYGIAQLILDEEMPSPENYDFIKNIGRLDN